MVCLLNVVLLYEISNRPLIKFCRLSFERIFILAIMAFEKLNVSMVNFNPWFWNFKELIIENIQIDE
jgi:hypothetical protein